MENGHTLKKSPSLFRDTKDGKWSWISVCHHEQICSKKIPFTKNESGHHLLTHGCCFLNPYNFLLWNKTIKMFKNFHAQTLVKK